MQHPRSFPLSVIMGATIAELIADDYAGCVREVTQAYLTHRAGLDVTPPSVFLRFPDKPEARIIGLASHLPSPWSVSGMKWIASYPANTQHGIPRASAVLLLNDDVTGHAFACLEGSIISAARTAASAVLAAALLHGADRHAETLGFVGAGLIAGYVYRFLAGTGWRIDKVRIFDKDPDVARNFANRKLTRTAHANVAVLDSAESVVAASDLVVFATTARTPHLTDSRSIGHHPTVLHLSLRDLAPELVLAADNVTDDVNHVMAAETSLHLAERLTQHRDFVMGTIADFILGERKATPQAERSRPVIFSPFGLGVLDLALAKWIHDKAVHAGAQLTIPDFAQASDPWG